MLNQINNEFESIAKTENKKKNPINEIFNSRINRRKNDFATKIKKCLQYQIK